MIHNLYTKELFKLEVLKTATGWQELSQAKLLPLEPKSGTLQELLQQVLQALEDRNAWELFFFNPPGNQPKHFGRWFSLFPRWDRLVSWRVLLIFQSVVIRDFMYVYWETHTMQRCLTRMLFRCLLLSRSLLVMFDCGYGVRLDGTYTVKLVLSLYRDSTLPNHLNNFHQFPECVAEPWSFDLWKKSLVYMIYIYIYIHIFLQSLKMQCQ